MDSILAAEYIGATIRSLLGGRLRFVCACGRAAQAGTIRGVTSSTTDRIAVQSFCFRGFASNEEVAAKAKEIGLAAVEPCRVHVDFTDEAAQDAAIAAYRDAGVRLVSCGVNSITGDAAGAECYFQFARQGRPVGDQRRHHPGRVVGHVRRRRAPGRAVRRERRAAQSRRQRTGSATRRRCRKCSGAPARASG